MPSEKPRYLRAALLNGFNLTALFGVFSVAAGTHDPLPALLAVGGELIYLGTVPALPFFKRRVERKLAKAREVRQKRAEILRKRLTRYDQAAEHRELMSHQLASIEDMLRLLHEQSIGMRDPEVVSRQLETISAEVETTEETVKELTAFLS